MRKRELRKIRERAFTCVENLEKHQGPGRCTRAGKTQGNKYNKGSGGANDVEWTKSDISVEEREGKMKGAMEIKENENSTTRDWKDERKKEKKSLGALYEGKSGIKYNEKGNRKGKKNRRTQNMYTGNGGG